MIIILTIGVYLLSISLILLFFKGANKIYKNSITLTPIDFEKSNIEKVTLIQELIKCSEEDDEFQRAILKNDVRNAIEEFYDSIQTKVNCLDMMGIPIETICKDQMKHYSKLKERGVNFK